MIQYIQRDKSDIFQNTLLGFLFKNKKFLFFLRLLVAAIFFYAIYFGFSHPGKENLFTGAVFWGIFWSLFMVTTLATFGRVFCSICPHSFIGKYLTKFGLKKTMPKWMQNRYIGLAILVIGWWDIYHTFPGFWNLPFNTALMFTTLSIFAYGSYFIYKDMSYCKYLCPIGTLTRAYDKLSFTKLETYTDECKECRTFECAKACPYDLKPFSFAKKNQSDDCTLCMECANSCEAVKFKFTKPAEQLGSKLKILNAEIWTYILILASIPVASTFANKLSTSTISDHFIWNKTAVYFGLSEYAGGFAFVYAFTFTLFFALLGLYLSSKVFKKDFNTIFTTLGVAYVPLFIFGSLSHSWENFFINDYTMVIEGFAQGFGFASEVNSIANADTKWLNVFNIFKIVGVVFTLFLLYKRIKLIESSRSKKILGYFFASFLLIFFIATNMYRGYILKTYGIKENPTKNIQIELKTTI